jgi:hypothetical protein
MKPLDDELHSLFKRKELPEGFAERVLARLDREPPRLTLAQRALALYRRPMLQWVAAAVLVSVMAILGIGRYRDRQRMRARAEQASREAILALRITNAELDAALERAQRATAQALKVPRNQSEKRSDL